MYCRGRIRKIFVAFSEYMNFTCTRSTLVAFCSIFSNKGTTWINFILFYFICSYPHHRSRGFAFVVFVEIDTLIMPSRLLERPSKQGKIYIGKFKDPTILISMDLPRNTTNPAIIFSFRFTTYFDVKKEQVTIFYL